MTQPVLATHSLTHTRTPHKYTHAYKRTAMHGTRTRTSGHCLTSPKIKAAKNRRGQWRGGAGRQGDGWGWPRADEGEGARRVFYFSAKVKVIIIIHSKGCCCTPSPRRRRRRTEGDDMKKKERKKRKRDDDEIDFLLRMLARVECADGRAGSVTAICVDLRELTV